MPIVSNLRPEKTRMQFDKQHLPAENLIARPAAAGMAVDHTTALPYMHMVGGFRLKGYWFHLRNARGTFPVGTTFDDVIMRYEFDRTLRLITWQSLDQIEIAIRTRMASYLSMQVNPHWLMEDSLFAQEPNPVYPKVKKEVDRSHDRAYIEHYRKRFYPLATIINYFLDNIGFPNDWIPRLVALFQAYPSIDKTDLGFGPDWHCAPGWTKSLNVGLCKLPSPPAAQRGNRRARRSVFVNEKSLAYRDSQGLLRRR